MPRKIFSLLFLGLFLLPGCRSGNETIEKQNAEILAEMKKLNHRLDQMDRQLKQIRADRQSAGFQRVPPDRDKLSKIQKLPENPTDQQIVEYIRQIREASIGQNTFSSNDPQIALYERIGPGHLRLLLPYLRNDGYHSPFYLHIVLPKLVGEADKELVRRSLKQYPILIRCVVRHGWLKEMKKEILSLLKQPAATNLPVGEIRNCIPDLVQSPDELKIVTDVYIHNLNGSVLLNGLKKLPGADIRKLVNQAWTETQKNPSHEHAMITRAKDAIRDGSPNIEAVRYLLVLLMTSDNPVIQNFRTQQIAPFLTTRCDFPIYDPPRLREWYGKNADRIIFDPVKNKYTLKQ